MKLKALWVPLSALALLGGTSSEARAQEPTPSHDATVSPTDQILEKAKQQLGLRYVFGGSSPASGFDCSGLIKYLLAAVKVDVPRGAAAQARSGKAVPRDIGQLRVGDLLTFGYGSRVSHVGLYIGDGKFIHASTGTHSVVESLLLRSSSRGIKPWIGVRRLAIADSR